MPTTTLVGARVVDGLGGDGYADVSIRDGLICAVVPSEPGRDSTTAARSGQVVDATGRWLTPGLVDLHLHGAYGCSVTTATVDESTAWLTALAGAGVTSVQPSLVAASTQRLAQQLTKLRAVVRGRAGGAARVLGAHLEGPFLALDQCGAHDPAALRSPTSDDLDVLTAAADIISMVTVAPEVAGVLDLVAWLSERDVVVAVGHSSAGVAGLQAAQAAGARHLTHLWSGQSGLRRDGPWRVPGLLEASLASDGMTAEVIADGRHLPPALLEIARRCLPGRLVLVSDATEGAGMPDGYRYRLGEVECVVGDGVGLVVGHDVFGGSTTVLPDMLRYVVGTLGWSPREAVPMVTALAADVLGRSDLGRIEVGARADLVLWDESWRVERVWLDGAAVT